MRLALLLMGLLLASQPVSAKVTPSEADALRTRLTPLGGERARNGDGTIPEWRGGLTAPPICHAVGARYCDPYADDRPHSQISAANLDHWRDKLSAGHIDLLQRHPQTYHLNLYPTRRSFANPGAVYEAAYRNALAATLAPSGNAVREASLAVPFPVPKDAVETIWNHRLRYRGPGYSRAMSQASVTATGEMNLIRLREDVLVPYALAQPAPDGMAMRWLQWARLPDRLKGTLTLLAEPLDPEQSPPEAWRQPASPHVIRRDRSHGFDSPALLSDDLRFDDQLDTWFGSPERYTWRIVDKAERVVPYNSYALHSGRRSLRELVRPAHLDPRLARYELHRVWIVEANLKPLARHRAARRRFYIDEDSWQILMVDLYDRIDHLWRWQEVHSLMAYDRGVLMPAVETIHDLESARYLVQGIDEGDPERAETSFAEDPDHFTPGGARHEALK